jgi:hypothetical protein
MARKQVLQRTTDVLRQVPAVGHLLRVWSALGKRLGVDRRAVTCHDLDRRMILKPRCDRR